MKRNISVNIHIFKEKFDENYEWLYNGGDQMSEYGMLIKAGDRFLRDNMEFVKKFGEHRGDLLTSDREIAAFYLTLIDMEVVQ